MRAEVVFAALQTHLGVRFVSGSEGQDFGDMRLTDPARGAHIAARLRDAVAVGAVSDLEVIAEELNGGDAAEAAVGQRLARLVANFDFDGVRDLATSLSDRRMKRDVV